MLEQYTQLLSKSPLFSGLAPGDIAQVLPCIGGHARRFAKGALLLSPGEKPQRIGMVLSGAVTITKEDVYGHRVIIAQASPGEVYGEAFVCAGNVPSAVSVQTQTDCEILLLNFDKVMQTCSAACPHHALLVRNMVALLAQKNLRLMERLEVLSKHSLREKLLCYLSQLAQAQNSSTVHSPLGRVALADYLGADRSALTRELNNMRGEGLIAFEKDTFTILLID